MANRQPPNIVYILSDEHRGQAMSHAGDPNVCTPNMDRLAAGGLSFARAYANCPICTPSRGTIFSGRHAHSGPVAGFFDNYKVAAPSTATELRRLGYRTAYFGKWHCGIVRNQVPSSLAEKLNQSMGGWARTPERHRAGFQDWFAYECINRHSGSFYYRNDDTDATFLDEYETDGLTNLLIDYMKSYSADGPLFAVLSVNPPHFPFDVPGQWQRFDAASLAVRPNFTESEDHRRMLALYYGMIENLDWNIGRLLAAMAEMPRFRDTLVVYFSDHGEFLGSHGIGCGKSRPQEEAVRIPAIFHWPGRVQPQGLADGLFSLVDMLPTTLGLIGAGVPAWVQGMDFSPLLRGEAFAGPSAVLLEMVQNPRWNMRDLDWRGLVAADSKYAVYENGDEVLYDLVADPFEQTNIAASDRHRRDHMRRLLLEELRRTREPFFDVVIEHGVPLDRPDRDVTLAPNYRKLNVKQGM